MVPKETWDVKKGTQMAQDLNDEATNNGNDKQEQEKKKDNEPRVHWTGSHLQRMQCCEQVKTEGNDMCTHQTVQNEEKKIEILDENVDEVSPFDTRSTLCVAMTKDASVDTQHAEHECGSEETDTMKQIVSSR